MRRIISIGLVVAIVLTIVLPTLGNSVVAGTLTGQQMACLQGGEEDCLGKAVAFFISCFEKTNDLIGCLGGALIIAILCYIGVL